MTTAVQFAREGKFLPLLFGVPLFIYCGFYHSIADTFYYLFSNMKPTLDMIFTLGMTYFGNYLGCSTYKLFITK
jgi:formate/nitrite transporter FocA (FNT family)